MAKKVLVAIAEGSEELESVAIIDTLRRAELLVTVASVDSLTITASRGVKITADVLLSDCTKELYDLVVCPGGLPGADHLRDSVDLMGILKAQAAAGKLYAAICASPAVVLQTHGLLEGKKATCYPSMRNQLDNWQDEIVVVDGNCITSQGPATAIPFALQLVKLLNGEKQAKSVGEGMLFK